VGTSQGSSGIHNTKNAVKMAITQVRIERVLVSFSSFFADFSFSSARSTRSIEFLIERSVCLSDVAIGFLGMCFFMSSRME